MARTFRFPISSRYIKTDVFQAQTDKGSTAFYFGTWEPIRAEGSDDDQFYVVTSSDRGRIDAISVRFYGTPDWWWAIAEANNLVDPLRIAPGTVLRIPRQEAILAAGGQ